jgi:hypothetical protein
MCCLTMLVLFEGTNYLNTNSAHIQCHTTAERSFVATVVLIIVGL